MSHSDPIADALTRIRNSSRVKHEFVDVPSNRTIRAVLDILIQEGFIHSIDNVDESSYSKIRVHLKYYEGKPVIRGLKRISKPGRRIYVAGKNIGSTLNNLGVGILTTSRGVLSDKQAKYQGIGGEYLCQVW